jgi:hypothetical protein
MQAAGDGAAGRRWPARDGLVAGSLAVARVKVTRVAVVGMAVTRVKVVGMAVTRVKVVGPAPL